MAKSKILSLLFPLQTLASFLDAPISVTASPSSTRPSGQGYHSFLQQVLTENAKLCAGKTRVEKSLFLAVRSSQSGEGDKQLNIIR